MLLLGLLLASVGVVAAALGVRASRQHGRRPVSPEVPSASPWLSLPAAPRPASVDDAWVLDAFDVHEIGELRRIDAEVRRDLTLDHQATILALVPGSRRDRRVQALAWADGRLVLVLGDGTALELDGVSRTSAVWLGYCRDQFGLVLEAIRAVDTAWSACLASCGVDTPLRVERVRVA